MELGEWERGPQAPSLAAPGLLLSGLSVSASDTWAGRPDAVTPLEDGLSMLWGRGGVQKVLRGPHCGERPLTAWGGDVGHGAVPVSEDEGRTVPPRWGRRRGCLLGPCWVEGNRGTALPALYGKESVPPHAWPVPGSCSVPRCGR